MRKLLSVVVSFAMALGALAAIGSVPGASGHTGHTFSVNDPATVGEGNGTVTFTITVTPTPLAGESLTVSYATANGTATAGSDYTLTSGSETFEAGQTNRAINVPILEDGVSEPTENFFLNLSNPLPAADAAIADGQGIATITDNDTGPALSINDVSQLELAAGTSVFAFTVTLAAPSAQTVTVNFATADGTALAASDYQAQTGVLTFVPTDVSETVNVLVNGDTTAEPDETFFVNLSGATNATISSDSSPGAGSQGVGTIRNDDGPLPVAASTFSISDVSRAEGNSGSAPTTPFTFTVTLAQPLTAVATVNYATADGTASVVSDYAFTSGNLSFPPGETAKTITVNVVGDTTTETNETFFVNLSGPSANATIADNQGLGTITNDDGPPPSPSPTPGPTVGTNTVKIGGFFQVRISGTPACIANRAFKVKRSQRGTDKVIVSGTTDSTGLYKVAKRPRKSGRYYAQIYPVTVGGTSCPAKKSPIRQLP